MKTTGLETELISGRRGEFTVWVDDMQVAEKTYAGFPTPEACAAAVQAAL